MSHTARIREYLSTGPATRSRIEKALHLTSNQVHYAIQGLLHRTEATVVGQENKHNLYALVETLPVATSKTLIAMALASEPELSKVWKP